jgi:hypothetical protein
MFLADNAATMLAERLGEAYDCNRSPYERRRTRAELVNRVRRSAGAAAIDVPPLPRAALVDAEASHAAELAFWSADSEAARASAVRRFLALGTGGVPLLTGLVSRLPESHPGRASVRRAAARAASMVREVTIRDDAVRLPNRDQILALEGESYSAPAVSEILVALTGAYRRGHAELLVHRDGEGRGVTLELSTAVEPMVVSSYVPQALQVQCALRVGTGPTQQSLEYHDPQQLFGRGPYRDFVAALDEALEQMPDVGSEALVVVDWSR